MPFSQIVSGRWLVGLSLFLILGLAACSPEGTLQGVETLTPEPWITPYRTLTPSRTPTLAERPLNQATQLPTPTPTPITYTIVEGDTMLSIALRFGLSLEELMAANPEVNPQFLSIDSELVIPLGEEIPPAPATPTPLPVSMASPVCYPSGEGGAWCFLLVENTRSKALENLSARITLYSAEGELLDESLAIPPLNLVPAGQALPLVAFFPPPLLEGFTAQANLLSALPVPRTDARYLDPDLAIEEVQIEASGLQATVLGRLALPKKSPPASTVWLAAVAYNSGGEVAGVRKWELVLGPSTEIEQVGPGTAIPALDTPVGTGTAPVSGTPTGPAGGGEGVEATSPVGGTQGTQTGPGNDPPDLLEAGEELPFEITVFSLGPGITRVEIVAELRP